MLARVSNIEAYRRWLNWKPLFEDQEEPTVEDFIRSITTDEPSEAMMAGTAFHAAIENAQDGEHETFAAMGYTFHLPDAEIALPFIRELRAFKEYGGLTVTGKVDCLDGKRVVDHKTTSRVDLDRYLEGCQWRFYLDIFGADAFEWHIFEIREMEPKVYRVSAPQTLRAYRYPGMADDCARLAGEFEEFATRMNLPDARVEA
ncbi:PD-(D/E)XK nuclease family protein [Devosia sp. ZB163]|uniref:PD-(D/E)XK nuclease family protein n=1 Tax=Devosia sp. ZB163 TaxID=3025938 RepID=UPI00236261EA|nr:PD-(D/E)XK nuclease family protein [Devosia sp. ZB163]MDC9825641.1 PD-(D/E)XK nuclease family protein [Devosia sp. ZB163]